MQQGAFWVYSGKDEDLELSFSTFDEAAEVAAKIPQGEVFQSMERLAGFCTDCDEFEEGGEGGATHAGRVLPLQGALIWFSGHRTKRSES